VYLHGAKVTGLFGEAELNGEAIPWEERSTPFDLTPVENWGPLPWHLHKGEHRTFYWPDHAPLPKSGEALATVAVVYSVGQRGERSRVEVPVDLTPMETGRG
jgi:hypothetical protein